MTRSALIVEDSGMMRKLIKQLSQRYFPVCHEAASGVEALELMSHSAIDLILTDINMIDMDGLEFISKVRQEPRYAKIPIVVVTTERNDETISKAVSLGASAFLPKPFQFDELEKIVKELLN